MPKSPKQQPTELAEVPTAPESLATNQQAIPLPLFAGERKITVRWIWRPQRSYTFPIGVQKAPQISIVAPINGAQVPTSGALALQVSFEDQQGDIAEVAVFSVSEDTGANYTEYLRKLIPATGSYTFTATTGVGGVPIVPAVEGNHRLVVQARDLTGRVVQRELTVFRYTSSTPVPPPIGALADGPYYVWFANFNGSSGYVVRYLVEKPAGIDYVAVPHTIQVRSRRSDGSWTSWSAWASNWSGNPGEFNYMVPKGARRQIRLRRDGDGVTSTAITLEG
jgi:hypothetical protein